MNTETIQWMPAIKLPDGHRLFPMLVGRDNPFHDKALPLVAITDNSGRKPEDTEDGILWLDFDWNLIISSPYAVLLIPVRRDCYKPGFDGNDDRFTTVTDMSTMMYLSNKYRWPIEDQFDGSTYTVKRSKSA